MSKGAIMKNFDLVSFGDTVVDFTPAGKTNKGTNLYERNPGGSTSNVACGVSRLGKKVAVMSAVGDDVIWESCAHGVWWRKYF